MAQEQPKKTHPNPTPQDPADAPFEAEIAARNPTRRAITRYDFPDDIEEAVAVYIFKMKGSDELVAAEYAEQNMTQAERKSSRLAAEAERRAGIRLSIVGIITRGDDGDLVRRHVDQATDLSELDDDWGLGAWAALRTYHADLNGVPWEELGKAVEGRRTIGGAPRSRGGSRPPG